jgi:hypothetical protein
MKRALPIIALCAVFLSTAAFAQSAGSKDRRQFGPRDRSQDGGLH